MPDIHSLLRSEPRRYAINPNRLLCDVLYQAETALYASEVDIQIQQAPGDNVLLYVHKESIEAMLQLLFNRVISLSRPGSTLKLGWSHSLEGLQLELSLDPPPVGPRVPLAAQAAVLRSLLRDSGVRYDAANSHGPWRLSFETIVL